MGTGSKDGGRDRSRDGGINEGEGIRAVCLFSRGLRLMRSIGVVRNRLLLRFLRFLRLLMKNATY